MNNEEALPVEHSELSTAPDRPKVSEHRRQQMRDASSRYYHRKRAEKGVVPREQRPDPPSYAVEWRRAYAASYYQANKEKILDRATQRYRNSKKT